MSFPLALDAAKLRLEELGYDELVGDPDLRPFIVKEVSWQQRWCQEQRVPMVAAMYVSAGECAVDYWLKERAKA